MTARVLALLALAASAVAAAQAPPGHELRLHVEPLPAAVPPLGPPVEAVLRVTAGCALVAEASAPSGAADVLVEVVSAPAWATVTAAPVRLSPTACSAAGVVEAEGAYAVSAAETGEAFRSEPLVLRASLRSAATTAEAEADTLVRAGFLGRMRADVLTPNVTTQPGGVAVARVLLENHGNAPLEFAFDVDAHPDGWGVAVPQDVVVPRGGEPGTAEVRVVPPPGGAFTREDGRVALRVRSAHASDPSVLGESAAVEFHVTVLGSAAERATPAPALALVVAAGAAAALSLKRTIAK